MGDEGLGWIHEHEVLVQFEDVDQYGMVHHPRYLMFMERARVALLGQIGMRAEDAREPEPGRVMGLVVLEVQLRYRKPARFLDQLVVRQGVRKLGAARIELDYAVERGAERIAEGHLQLAFVTAGGKPCRPSPSLRAALARMGSPLVQ